MSAGAVGISPGAPTVGVALRLAARRVEVDPLTGVAAADRVPPGASAAGLAALETGLRLATSWGVPVTVAAAGPAAAEPMLRDALARGADRAVRVWPPGEPPPEEGEPPGLPAALEAAAAALALALGGCPVIVCGDGGHDSGTGAVPALLAARLGRAQALGLTVVGPGGEPGTVAAERRLDRGWRERLLVRAPMVLSVESAAARPRRAPLDRVLSARDAAITVLAVLGPTGPGPTGPGPTGPGPTGPGPTGPGLAGPGPAGAGGPGEPATVLPYRPRARVLPPPAGASPLERVLNLIAAASPREPPRRVEADPATAAREIYDQLRKWERG